MQRTSKQLWQGDGATLQPVLCEAAALQPLNNLWAYHLHATIYFHKCNTDLLLLSRHTQRKDWELSNGRELSDLSDTWGGNLSPGSTSFPPFLPHCSPLSALHRSMVLFLNEHRHRWRYRTLTICGNLLHMLQGFIDPVCIHRFTPI